MASAGANNIVAAAIVAAMSKVAEAATLGPK
jgi:hypothetical protein